MSQNIPRITQHSVAKLLPRRQADSHKGLFGTVTVIGGATGMTGAALLAARAALKLGAGCVHVVFLTEDAPGVDLMQPELMLHKALGRDEHGPFFNADVILAGCGMGLSPLARTLLNEALQSTATLVLDADALNLLAQDLDLCDRFIGRRAPAVLTPHPGEAARLLKLSPAQIQQHRARAAQALTDKFRCAVTLKGAHTLCASPDKLLINHTGNPGMSAPGMGDVLAGIIAALIAQGLRCEDAMSLAVHLNGAAGDELATQFSTGMTATELTDQARRLLNQWISPAPND